MDEPERDHAYGWTDAEADTILRVLVGSSVHGVAVDGTDDRDEMAVFIPPPLVVLGLRSVETIVHRTQPEGVRSGPGDLDLTLHTLHKFCRLAVRGNPTILLAFFSPDPIVCSGLGERLRAMAPSFASKRAVRAFLGYMGEQRLRMEGQRGQRGVNRPELVERYGFDTKYAGHVVRLGLQGIEYAQTGRLSLPMGERDRDLVLAVRQGEFSMEQVLDLAQGLEGRLQLELERSPLPEQPDHRAVEEFLTWAYLRQWSRDET